jgi:hypothetical protein
VGGTDIVLIQSFDPGLSHSVGGIDADVAAPIFGQKKGSVAHGGLAPAFGMPSVQALGMKLASCLRMKRWRDRGENTPKRYNRPNHRFAPSTPNDLGA